MNSRLLDAVPKVASARRRRGGPRPLCPRHDAFLRVVLARCITASVEAVEHPDPPCPRSRPRARVFTISLRAHDGRAFWTGRVPGTAGRPPTGQVAVAALLLTSAEDWWRAHSARTADEWAEAQLRERPGESTAAPAWREVLQDIAHANTILGAGEVRHWINLAAPRAPLGRPARNRWERLAELYGLRLVTEDNFNPDHRRGAITYGWQRIWVGRLFDSDESAADVLPDVARDWAIAWRARSFQDWARIRCVGTYPYNRRLYQAMRREARYARDVLGAWLFQALLDAAWGR
mgnify:CR=1 FL=1